MDVIRTDTTNGDTGVTRGIAIGSNISERVFKIVGSGDIKNIELVTGQRTYGDRYFLQ